MKNSFKDLTLEEMIAKRDELRKQYWIGYYPEDTGSQGELRNVRVRVTRPNLAVRTKNRYIVGKGNRLSGRKSPSSEEPDFFKRRND